MATIAFIHGWSEGPWHSKMLEDKFTKEGINTTHDLKNADIIFCHSTGCYLIPKSAKAKLVVLVGLPYWPERSLVYSGLHKVIEDFNNTVNDMGVMWWSNKMLHNFWYMIKFPKDTIMVAAKHHVENLPNPKKHKVILVRNEQDCFTNPEIAKILNNAKDYKLVSLPAGHDDCWTGKQIYVDLIKNEL